MIRIYALAKELKVDNKVVVEICRKVGLEGKKSALASLSDEEEKLVRDYHQKSTSEASATSSSQGETLEMRRPTISLKTGKIPVLKPLRPRTPKKPAPQETPVPTPETSTTEKAGSDKEQQVPTADSDVTTQETGKSSTGWDAPVPPTLRKDLSKKVPVIQRPATPKTSAPEQTPPESRPEKKERPRLSAPLTALINRRSKSDDSTTTSSNVTTKEPVPTPPPAPEAPVVEELSPLEQARLAAARERQQRPHFIGMPDTGKKKKPDKSGKEDGKNATHGKKGLNVHVAPLPSAPEKPAVPKGEKEPAAQKPIIRINSTVTRDTPLSDIIEKVKSGDSKTLGKSPKSIVTSGKDKGKGGFTGILDPDDEMGINKKGDKKRGKGKKRGEESSGRRPSSNDFTHMRDEDQGDHYYSPRQPRSKKGAKSKVSTVPRKGDIVIEMPCTVKDFAEATGLSVAVVIKKMMELGYMLTINQPMNEEIAEMLIEAFELKAVVKKEVSLEDQFVNAALDQEDPPETLKPRPPVVTFLGHVDHGKTSLLDRILHMNVVSGEKGGITQHIRSYRIQTKGGDVTFVDTPGHEAFTEMRARGANCTDIAVLVVAADDGVMPQTEEAISHIKAAGVPIVVALNKMDLPGVSRDRVVQELAGCDLMPSEWGGDVEIVETSAVTGMGIDSLMETLLLTAELHELKARPDRLATGMAIETSMEAGQGVRCTLLVQNGTLKTGDVVLCGNAYGKVRAMFDTLDATKEMTEAGPSTPVVVLGLDTAPGAGSKFVVLEDISVARQIAEERTRLLHERELAGGESHVTLETLRERLMDAKTQQTLNVIIRTDVRGSIEAIRKELSKLDHPEVKIRILQASVGGITEADVLLADASDAIIVGFNVVPDELAREAAEKKKVQIRRYDIIYKLSEDIKAALEGMLKPIEQVKELGRTLVQQTFSISRIGTIAGCRVLSGTVERDCRIRVIRDSRVIGEYLLETLKREKDDAREVREGYECGIKLKGYNDIKEGDIFEAYKIEEIARTLD